VVRELGRWGGQRRRRAIIEAVFVALVDPAGVMVQRRGVLERARWVLSDWRAASIRLAEVEARMVEVLDQLELTELVTSIPGVSAVGAAAMLAETGDPTRFDSPRALVKHAGLSPRVWTAPAPGSSMPGCAPPTAPAAPSTAERGSPGVAAPGCGWPPGARHGVPFNIIRRCSLATGI